MKLGPGLLNFVHFFRFMQGKIEIQNFFYAQLVTHFQIIRHFIRTNFISIDLKNRFNFVTVIEHFFNTFRLGELRHHHRSLYNCFLYLVIMGIRALYAHLTSFLYAQYCLLIFVYKIIRMRVRLESITNWDDMIFFIKKIILQHKFRVAFIYQIKIQAKKDSWIKKNVKKVKSRPPLQSPN